MKQIPIDDIRIDGGIQARIEINIQAVAEYAEAMTDGVDFPPVDLFFDGASYWLAHGFHRYHAARRAEVLEIASNVTRGTQQDAQWHSAATNQDQQGVRRTNADKRRAVEIALKAKPQLSDNAIANHVGVTHPFVATCRASCNGYKIEPTRTVTRNGKTYQQDTSNIGVKERKEQQVIEKAEAMQPVPKSRGKGIRLAHEAIGKLQEIPVNDALRTLGLNTVEQWIKDNR